jgi:hypothetical protein
MVFLSGPEGTLEHLNFSKVTLQFLTVFSYEKLLEWPASLRQDKYICL